MVQGSGMQAHQSQFRSGSRYPDIAWVSQLEHAVQCVDSDRHLGRPALIRVRAQLVADHLLPSVHGGFDPGDTAAGPPTLSCICSGGGDWRAYRD